MSGILHTTMLWVAPAWPLLLAIPALHTRIPGVRYLAIAPAAVLALWPGRASLEIDWLLFGSGVAIDGELRWILALVVALWIAAAVLMRGTRPDAQDARVTTFFMLSLAGNLGAVLVTELVGFFAFATLTGYAFYGLLAHDADAGQRRAAGRYLKFLVVADLALFEALLLAAYVTQDLRFAVVREALANSASGGFYAWMVLGAFVLRAGVWPLHVWLPAVFGTAAPARLLVLIAGPLLIALLGVLRWLPIGFSDMPGPWWLLLLGGIAAALYGVARLLLVRSSPRLIPAWASLVITGALFAGLAAGIADADAWRAYAHLRYPAIVLPLVVLAALVLFDTLRGSKPRYSK